MSFRVKIEFVIKIIASILKETHYYLCRVIHSSLDSDSREINSQEEKEKGMYVPPLGRRPLLNRFQVANVSFPSASFLSPNSWCSLDFTSSDSKLFLFLIFL